jgi:hypothetical protein
MGTSRLQRAAASDNEGTSVTSEEGMLLRGSQVLSRSSIFLGGRSISCLIISDIAVVFVSSLHGYPLLSREDEALILFVIPIDMEDIFFVLF